MWLWWGGIGYTLAWASEFLFSGSYFAQILRGHAVILTARHSMNKSQHLVLGLYEFCFVGTKETQ